MEEGGQGCQEELFIIHIDIYKCDPKTIYFSQVSFLGGMTLAGTRMC